MASSNTFVFVGGYGSAADARADYELVKDLHAAGAVGTYAGEAALIVIGEDKLADRIDAARMRAVTQVEKQIDADAEALKRELEEAAKQVA